MKCHKGCDKKYEFDNELMCFYHARKRGYIRCDNCIYWEKSGRGESGICSFIYKKQDDEPRIMFSNECCRNFKYNESTRSEDQD